MDDTEVKQLCDDLDKLLGKYKILEESTRKNNIIKEACHRVNLRNLLKHQVKSLRLIINNIDTFEKASLIHTLAYPKIEDTQRKIIKTIDDFNKMVSEFFDQAIKNRDDARIIKELIQEDE